MDERLLDILKRAIGYLALHGYEDEARKLGFEARAALAATQAEPIAWMHEENQRECISELKKRDMLEHNGIPGRKMAEKYSIPLGVIAATQAPIYQVKLKHQDRWTDMPRAEWDLRIDERVYDRRIVYAAPESSVASKEE